MRQAFGMLALLAFLLASFALPLRAEAAVSNFVYSQTCANGKANVNLQWSNVDPGAQELWVDLATKNDFSEGMESRGPLGRVSNYVWNGLEAHSVYFVRVNQKLASGDWDASGVGRVVTACGTTPAAATATFTVRGFSDQVGPQGRAPADLTEPGGTLATCKPARIYAFITYADLDDLTDFIGTWTGPNYTRSFAWALSKGSGPQFFTQSGPAAGWPPGNYTFKFTSGGEVSPIVHIDTAFKVC